MPARSFSPAPSGSFAGSTGGVAGSVRFMSVTGGAGARVRLWSGSGSAVRALVVSPFGSVGVSGYFGLFLFRRLRGSEALEFRVSSCGFCGGSGVLADFLAGILFLLLCCLLLCGLARLSHCFTYLVDCGGRAFFEHGLLLLLLDRLLLFGFKLFFGFDYAFGGYSMLRASLWIIWVASQYCGIAWGPRLWRRLL